MNKQTSSFTIDTLYLYYQKYNNQVFIGMLLIAATIGGGYFYRGYQQTQEQSAQTAFSVCIQELERALQGKTNWQEVELASKAGYQQHRSAAVAPFFLAIQAQSLIQQNKKTEGAAIIDELLQKISKNSPLFYSYAITRALLNLDISDKQSTGLEQLKELAANSLNPLRDEALYYLMSYYERSNELEKAQQVKKDLISAFPQSGPAASPFAERVARQIASSIES